MFSPQTGYPIEGDDRTEETRVHPGHRGDEPWVPDLEILRSRILVLSFGVMSPDSTRSTRFCGKVETSPLTRCRKVWECRPHTVKGITKKFPKVKIGLSKIVTVHFPLHNDNRFDIRLSCQNTLRLTCSQNDLPGLSFGEKGLQCFGLQTHFLLRHET